MNGIVVAFDERQGLGTIEDDERSYPFHCTALVDGSRAVHAGTPVTFDVRPGGMGRWEAANIVKLATGS